MTYGWDPNQIADMTMPQVVAYLLTDDELKRLDPEPEGKPMSVEQQLALYESIRARQQLAQGA